MKINYKFKKILSSVLGVAVLIVTVGAIASIATNDTKKIGAQEFEVGALSTTDGQYVKDETAIYTKEAIECQDLKIKPEFDSDATYQIFWYNYDEVFFGCSEKTVKPYTIFNGPVPEHAKYCRIVIYPSQLDEDGEKIKDFKVSFFSISKIVKNLNITVAKEQDFEVENLFEDLTVEKDGDTDYLKNAILNGDKVIFEGYAFSNSVEDTSSVVESDTKSIVCFQSKDVAVYKLDLSESTGYVKGYFFDDYGMIVEEFTYLKGEVAYIEVPEESQNLSFCLVLDDVIDSSSLTVYIPRY